MKGTEKRLDKGAARIIGLLWVVTARDFAAHCGRIAPSQTAFSSHDLVPAARY